MVSKQPTHTTQTTKVELPEWVDAASQKNYQLAESIANKPYEAYQGQTVADTSQTTNDAYDFFKSTMGTGNAQTQQANGLFAQAGQGIAGMDRSAYMNPFIDQVENKALGALDKSRVQALMGNSDSAIAAKAFGGSRHGVVDAVTNAETADKAGLLSANLRKEGFDASSGLMQQDIQNMMSGGQGLLAGGEALGKQRGTDFSGLLGIGSQQQLQDQRALDDAKGRWDDQQGYDTERLNLMLSSLGMSPYGKSENTDKVTEGGSSGTDFAQMGLGVLSLLFGLSDETTKTDVKKVGKDPETGLDIFSFRYKGDPKSYPKVVGPMAQDVEKLYPELTTRIGGKLAVRNDFLRRDF